MALARGRTRFIGFLYIRWLLMLVAKMDNMCFYLLVGCLPVATVCLLLSGMLSRVLLSGRVMVLVVTVGVNNLDQPLDKLGTTLHSEVPYP